MSKSDQMAVCGSSDNGTAATGSNDAGSKAVYRTLDEIKESGTINIGVFSDKNPFGYVDEKIVSGSFGRICV